MDGSRIVPGDHSPVVPGRVLLVAGLGLTVAAASPAGLSLILVRKVLVAVGSGLGVLGVLVLVVGRSRPLDPLLAWWVPAGVLAALAGLLGYDLWRLGGAEAIRIALKPTQGILLGAAFGIPAGAALRRRRRGGAVAACAAGAIAYLAVWWYYARPAPSPSVGEAGVDLAFVAVLGLPGTVIGALLTPATRS